MTSKDITKKLSRHFAWRKNIIIPNYQQGTTGYEADLLIVRPSGWVEEVEIKISLSDFKADFKNKARKHLILQDKASPRQPFIAKKFWFAVPGDIADKVMELLPPYAGLIVVDGFVTVRKPAPTLKHAKKISPAKITHIYKCIYYRFWENKDSK